MFVSIKRSVLLTFCLCFFVQISFAKQYDVPELFMTINIPDTYNVITNKTNNGLLFDSLKLDKQEVLKNMKDNNVYLWIFDNKEFYLISGIINNEAVQKIGDYRNYPNLWSEKSYQDSFKKTQKDKFNQDITSFSSYTNNNNLYYVSSGSVRDKDNSLYYIKQYQTVKNGVLVGVTGSCLFKDKKNFDDKLLPIVNSISFTNQNTAVKINTPAFIPKNENIFVKAISDSLAIGIFVGIFFFIKFIGKYVWSKIKMK